jgi:hypothetical protein
MKEIIFVVEDAPEGGYTAQALGESIFTEAENIEELHSQTREAVICHFGDDQITKLEYPDYARES